LPHGQGVNLNFFIYNRYLSDIPEEESGKILALELGRYEYYLRQYFRNRGLREAPKSFFRERLSPGLTSNDDPSRSRDDYPSIRLMQVPFPRYSDRP
jgi:hypothetical protein